MFYPPDLSDDQMQVLRKYVKEHRADTDNRSPLKLVTCKDFLKKFFASAYKTRSLVVGFNLPFDLSRLGFDVTTARGEFAGGFSLGLWTYTDKTGRERPDPNRPRITIKHTDSKRARISLTARKSPDQDDLIPEGSKDGKAQKGYRFRGNFLDLRTLAFALTDRGHSLKSACETFGVVRGKLDAAEHGNITEAYLDYNRRDVEATASLAVKLLEEFDRHPIPLHVTRASSPASLGKAYLKSMGITPILSRQRILQPFVGYAQTAHLWWADQRPYPQGRCSHRLHRFPVDVSDREQPYEPVAVRNSTRDQVRRSLP